MHRCFVFVIGLAVVLTAVGCAAQNAGRSAQPVATTPPAAPPAPAPLQVPAPPEAPQAPMAMDAPAGMAAPEPAAPGGPLTTQVYSVADIMRDLEGDSSAQARVMTAVRGSLGAANPDVKWVGTDVILGRVTEAQHEQICTALRGFRK